MVSLVDKRLCGTWIEGPGVDVLLRGLVLLPVLGRRLEVLESLQAVVVEAECLQKDPQPHHMGHCDAVRRRICQVRQSLVETCQPAVSADLDRQTR